MREKGEGFLKRCVYAGAFFPGIIVYILYCTINYFTKYYFVFSLFKARVTLASIVSAYSFTAMGFLGAIVAIALAVPDTYKLKKFKSEGLFDVYLLIIKCAFVCLLFSFLSSLLLLSSSPLVRYILTIMLVFVVNSMFLIAVSILILLCLLKRDRE